MGKTNEVAAPEAASEATVGAATTPTAASATPTTAPDDMSAQAIIDYIATAPKKTPAKAYVRLSPGAQVDWPAGAHVFGGPEGLVVFAEHAPLMAALASAGAGVEDAVVECDRRNSGVPLLDISGVNARIEPGAIIRDRVEIGDNAVIMMGAIINIGAVVGPGTMIDMGVVLGGRAIVGARCHIGAGTVLAGVVEPASATPVVVEDDVMVGANCVVLEGCRVGEGAVVAAGAIVTQDVPPHTVVAGCPARVIKQVDDRTAGKTALVDALRSL